MIKTILRSKACKSVFFAVPFIASTIVNAADWPNWRGPQRNGIVNESIKNRDWERNPPKVLWRVETGWASSNVSVGNGVVVTLGFEPSEKVKTFDVKGVTTVYCFEEKTGKLRWEKEFPSVGAFASGPSLGGPAATPTIESDRVYTISRDGHVHCWKLKDGSVIWQRNFSEERNMDWSDKKQIGKIRNWTGFESSPFIVDDYLFINVGRYGMVVNKNDGKTIWESPVGPHSHSTPTFYEANGKRMLALFAADSLKGIELENGKVAWSFPWRTRHQHNGADVLVLSNNRFFMHSGYGMGGAMIQASKRKPELLWKQENSPDYTPMILHEGYAYGSGRAIRMSDGEVTHFKRGVEYEGIIKVGELFLSLTAKSELLLLDLTPDAYTVLSRYKPFLGADERRAYLRKTGGRASNAGGRTSQVITSPVFANGKVFVRNCVGEVICLSLD